MHEWISIHIHIGECTYTHTYAEGDFKKKCFLPTGIAGELRKPRERVLKVIAKAVIH